MIPSSTPWRNQRKAVLPAPNSGKSEKYDTKSFKFHRHRASEAKLERKLIWGVTG